MSCVETDLAPDPVDIIRRRRDLLASVLGILRFMEGLQESLEAVQLLGEKVRGVPAFAQRFLGGLDARLVETDTGKLRGYLDALERLVKQDLTRVLKIAGAERRTAGRAGDPAPGEPPPDEYQLVDDFRRRTLTVVSLRILLRKRGESVGVVALPVPQELLAETLAKLQQERCAYSERALGEALMLMKDIDLQLQKKTLGDAMRNHLVQMRNGLQQNIDHLKAGKPVSDLPVPMESSEAQEIDWLAGKRKQPAEVVVEAPGAEEQTEESVPADSAGGSLPSPGKRGFLARLMRYVTTGPEVGWKDTG